MTAPIQRSWSKIVVVSTSIAGISVGLFLAARCGEPQKGKTFEPLEEQLMSSFEGSYPTAPNPTGNVREFTFDAAPTTLELLDGRPIDVWAYEGKVPGPTLRVVLGDTVRVHFTNHLAQPTTIHWHGVRLPNAMDGVPGVTQPPIQPGETFVYEFVPKDAGTFWFHPHVRGSEQLERGLYGVLVVEDQKPPPFSRDLVWVLDDWRLTADGSQIDPQFNTRHDLAHDGRWGTFLTVNGREGETLRARAGERLRIRLLDAANGRVFKPDFGALDAKVIAVDGLYAARTVQLNDLEIAPGNRVDLDVTIPKTLRGKRVEVLDRFTRIPITIAIIDVADEDPVETPTFPSPATGHVPDWSAASSLSPRLDLRLNAQAGGELGTEWTINGMAFSHDHMSAHANQALPLGVFSKV